MALLAGAGEEWLKYAYILKVEPHFSDGYYVTCENILIIYSWSLKSHHTFLL